VATDQLPSVFESLASDVMKEHERRFQERIRSVREACNTLDNAAVRFEGAVRNAWGTMDQTASEYGTRMAQTIEESARKLSREPASSTYQDTDRFHKDSIEALNTIIKTVRRYLPKLRRGLRVELATLNVALGKLETTVRSLGAALDQSPGSKIALLRREIAQLAREREELTRLKADQAEAGRLQEANAVQERDLLQVVSEFSSSQMFQELARYEESLATKEEELSQFLQPIIKPLTKLERNESNSRSKTVDLVTLREIIDKPVETVVTGQVFALIQLLTQLEDALRQGRIEIEERRRRKAQETIREVNDGAIERLRQDYLTIQANVQETKRQLRAAGLLDKRGEVQQRQAEVRNEQDRLANHILDLQRRTESLTKTLTRHKESLEHEIKQATGKDLNIRID